jgi:phosphoribosyl-ATP pyrophosphohydrolase
MPQGVDGVFSSRTEIPGQLTQLGQDRSFRLVISCRFSERPPIYESLTDHPHPALRRQGDPRIPAGVVTVKYLILFTLKGVEANDRRLMQCRQGNHKEEYRVFREKIGLFITEERAKLYVPKNSGLNEYVSSLLREVGVSEEGGFERADGGKGKLEIMSARGEDVPQRVDDCLMRGESAYGLTGDDLFDEYMLGADDSPLGVLNTYDWFDPHAQFNRPALCLLNPLGELPDSASVSIAANKKYERTSREYLAQRFDATGVNYTVVAYAGDTENTVAEGTHDWCVEVVYRGEKSSESALARTKLKVAEIVRFSDISLIGKEIVNPWLEEYRRIWTVARNPTDSSTSRLLADDNEICKKLGEESAEFVRAFVQEDGVAQEYNGVVYAMMVAAARTGVAWQEIESDLRSRWE